MSKPSTQKKSTKSPAKASGQIRVRIRLQSFDHKLLDASADKIVDVAKNAQGKVVGPIPLPTRRQVYCVNRSPHVNKKSREHFEIRSHKRLLDVIDPGPDFANQLSRLDLPAGVDIEVRL